MIHSTESSQVCTILISQLYFLNFYLGRTPSLPPAPAPSPTAECECKVWKGVPEWLCEPLRGCYDGYSDDDGCRLVNGKRLARGYEDYDLVECMEDLGCLGNFPASVLDLCGIEE